MASFIAAPLDAVNQTTYTFSGITFPAGRVAVFVRLQAGVGVTLGSLTINGVSVNVATPDLDGSFNANNPGMWFSAIVSAGTGSVVVGASGGNANRCAIAVYDVVGLVYATGTVDDTANPSTVDANTQAGDVALCSSYVFGATSYSATGLPNERFDGQIEGSNYHAVHDNLNCTGGSPEQFRVTAAPSGSPRSVLAIYRSASSVATAAGTATASAAGASTAAAAASSAGVAAGSATGGSDARAAGSASGVATAVAVGQSDAAGAASAASTATVTATGLSDATAAGSASGASTAAGVAGTGASTATAAGTSVASAIGRAESHATAAASGTAAASATGQSDIRAIGTAGAGAAAAATGRADAAATASASGTATAAAASVAPVTHIVLAAYRRPAFRAIGGLGAANAPGGQGRARAIGGGQR